MPLFGKTSLEYILGSSCELLHSHFLSIYNIDTGGKIVGIGHADALEIVYNLGSIGVLGVNVVDTGCVQFESHFMVAGYGEREVAIAVGGNGVAIDTALDVGTYGNDLHAGTFE